jgi:hypothetical protein
MKVLILISSLLISLSVLAVEKGNGSSGGGASVVCRDRDNRIVSAELLDTFEAPYLYGFEVRHSNEDIDVQINNALNKLSVEPFYKALILNLIKDIKSKIQFLPEGISLNAPSDIGESDATIIREGCRLEGVGFYNKEGVLRVAPATFNHFSNTDQAAFLLHESLYFTYRVWHEQQARFTSEKARNLTAMFFSHKIDNQSVLSFLKLKILAHQFEEVETQILLKKSYRSSEKIRVILKDIDFEVPPYAAIGVEFNHFTVLESNHGTRDGKDIVYDISGSELPSFVLRHYIGYHNRLIRMIVTVGNEIVHDENIEINRVILKRVLFARSDN